jgi:hypothetical protein
MYPRQPFDFAGRTGRVVFDVGNDTQGSHMAWPEFVLSDQPVPAPHQDASGVADFARNSVGVSLGAACDNGALVDNANASSWSVSNIYMTSNYGFSLPNYTLRGCVKKGSVTGGLNHVEIRLSSNHLEVWATDPGSTTLVQLATADFQMPLTRGLAWMEDVHYNASKAPGTQGTHTFAWDNFGFDGPVLSRDLGFDVPDAHQNFTGSSSLGWDAGSGGNSLNVQIQNVRNVSSASAALLEFTWWPRTQASISVALNGHPAHNVPWPYGNALTYKSMTLAVPIPLNEIVTGTNSLSITTSDLAPGASLANIDLILAGAGGAGSGGSGGGLATNTPTPTATATTRATSTPTSRATSTPTATPTSRTRATSTPTSTPRSTSTPTSTPNPSATYTTSASVTPSTVRAGGNVNVGVTVTSSTNSTALVDLEIYDANGNVVFQKYWDNQTFTARQPKTLSTTWSTATRGTYTVKIGMFGPGWSEFRAWNNNAATITVN